MSKLNTLYKIVNTMKEEEYELNQMKVEAVKGEESTVLFEGKHERPEGHFRSMGHGRRGHHGHGEGRPNRGMKGKEGFKSNKLSRISMALKALDKLEITDTDEGKILTLEVSEEDAPKEMKEMMIKRKAWISENKDHMEERKEKMKEKFKDHPKFEEMKAVREKAKNLGLNPEDCEFKSATIKAFVDQNDRVKEINIVATIETKDNETIVLNVTKSA